MNTRDPDEIACEEWGISGDIDSFVYQVGYELAIENDLLKTELCVKDNSL